MGTKHEWESWVGHSNTPSKQMEKKDLKRVVHSTLDNYLTEKERKCVRLLFGLDETRTYTLDEVASLVGLTRQRVYQIRLGSLQKLKKVLKSQKGNLLQPVMA